MINKITSNKKNILIFLLIATFITSFSLLLSKMYWGHDLVFHLSRIRAIKDNLNLGVVGGYMYPNYLDGYGYGNPLFYPDIFLYIPAIISYLGLSILSSYKLFLVLINFLTFLTMYITIKSITGNKKSAIVSSIMYGCASYKQIDMYTRAALGETLSFIFIPLIILGIYEIIYRDKNKFYILVIGMSGLILCHLISTYLICIVLVILCLLNIKKLIKENRIWYIVISAIITILLTSYFVFPMLEQMLNDKFFFNNLDETSHLSTRALPLWSLFIEFPYYSYTKLWIPMGIGVAYVVSTIIYFKNYKKCTWFIHFCYITSIAFLIASTNIFPWNLFKSVLSPIQFPWRFYLISTLLISIATGLLIDKIKLDLNKYFVYILILCIIPAILINTLNCFNSKVIDYNKYEISFGEYMPEGATEDYIYKRGNIITSTYPITHEFTKKGLSMNIKFNDNKKSNTLELPLLYYKGYSAKVNGEYTSVSKSDNGLVLIDINQNSGEVIVNYECTIVQHVTKIISIITLISFSYYVIKKEVQYEK